MLRLRLLARLPLLLALLAVAGCRGGDGVQTHTGSLAAGDETLESGEYVDGYNVRVKAGQWVLVEMASSAFSPYVILRSPSGDQAEDAGADGRAVVRQQATEAGLWRVQATSDKAGDVGSYTLSITVSDAEPSMPGVASGGKRRAAAPSDTASTSLTPPAQPDTTAAFVVRPGRAPSAPESAAEGGTQEGEGVVRQVQGVLEEGDDRLESGEYADRLDLEVQRGQTIVVEMASQDFAPYLILRSSSGEQKDDNGDDSRDRNARIEVRAGESGTWKVAFTSANPGETGTYRARISVR